MSFFKINARLAYLGFCMLIGALQTSVASAASTLILDFRHDTDYQISSGQSPDDAFLRTDADSIQLKKLTTYRQIRSYFQQNYYAGYRQIIFAINAHGTKDLPGIQEHGFVLEDGSLSASELLSFIQEITRAGQKAALLDFSCHSGVIFEKLRQLNAENFCLITGDSVGETSIAPFRGNFFRLLGTKSSSLEDLFLDARKTVYVTQGTPGINSTAGLAARDRLGFLQKVVADSSNFLALTSAAVALPDVGSSSAESDWGIWLRETSNLPKYEAARASLLQAIGAYLPALDRASIILDAPGTSDFIRGKESYSNYARFLYGPESLRILDKLTLEMIYGRLTQEERSMLANLLNGPSTEQAVSSNVPNWILEEVNRIQAFKATKAKLIAEIGQDTHDFIFIDAGIRFLNQGVAELFRLETDYFDQFYRKNRVTSDACHSIVLSPKGSRVSQGDAPVAHPETPPSPL